MPAHGCELGPSAISSVEMFSVTLQVSSCTVSNCGTRSFSGVSFPIFLLERSTCCYRGTSTSNQLKAGNNLTYNFKVLIFVWLT